LINSHKSRGFGGFGGLLAAADETVGAVNLQLIYLERKTNSGAGHFFGPINKGPGFPGPTNKDRGSGQSNEYS